jgi:endonuclease YncB( thermonuclease family)
VVPGRCSRFASRAAAFACGVALLHPAFAQDGDALTGIVTGVLEGDTIRLQLPSGPTVVRLAYIDAPEPRQPDGPEARRALHGKLIGAKVRLEVTAKDAEGWLQGVVYLGDEDVNAWILKQGHAWVDRAQAKNPAYCMLENAARSLKRGLWAGEEWLAPWEWRQGGKGKAMRYTDYRKADAASCIAELGRKT